MTTALQYPRDFSISGDVATASSVSFDGTSNVNLSVALSTNFSANTLGIITASQFSTGSTGIGINTDTISGPSIIYIDPSPVGVGTTSGIVRIKGDLYVDGTQFVVNSSTIELADLRVGIATTVGTNFLLDGGGIGIGSANILKTFTYNQASYSLKSSENLDINTGKTYKIDGTEVLSSTTLGSGITNSSLTSVGTLISLSVGNVNSTGIITATKFVGSVGFATTATNVIGGIGSLSQLSVSGFSTVGVLTATKIGIGTTNPTSELFVIGNSNISGIVTIGVGNSAVVISAGIITSSGVGTVTYFGNLTGTASTASFATTSFTLNGRTESQFNVAFASTAGIATNLKGGATNSIPVQTGINSTAFIPIGGSGNFLRSNGSVTAPSWETLPSTTVNINASSTSVTQFPLFVSDSVATGTLSINKDLFSFIPLTSNPRLGIGTGSPTFNLDVRGTGRFTGIVSASGLTISGIVTVGAGNTGVKIDGTTGIITSISGFTTVTFVGNLTGTASTASFATTSFTLNGRTESQLNVAFAQTAGISTNVIGGIASVTSLSVSGFSTVGVLTATKIGIGTTNPTSELWVSGDVFVSGIITATDYDSASDIRLKENIQKIDNPIDKIIRIDGVTFDWKSGNKSSMGVIAQNIEKVLPQLVHGEDSKTVNYNGIIGLLIECVKTQQEQIDNLNRRLDELSK